MRESRANQARALVLTVLLHVGIIALVWWSARWVWNEPQTAAGEPIQATLQVSAADLRRATQAIRAAEKSVPAKPLPPPRPQPQPAPRPQDSDTPLQMRPQAPQDHPDTVNQDEIKRNALLKAEQEAKEQEAKRRQEQVDLTEDIARQQEVERRQRLREQLEAVQKQRADAEKKTKMEAQRLQQLMDNQVAAAPSPKPPTPAPAAPVGNRGEDQGLKNRYIAAIKQTADANWIRGQAPELTHCRVRLTQIPGGEVIDVTYLNCPFDAAARDSVDRALRKTPMPYSGFEPVFTRQVEIDFCYPKEACAQ